MKKLSVIEQYLLHRPLFLGFIRSAEAELFKKYLRMRKPSLDIGCGDGFFAKLVFGKIDFGLDLKDSRIDQADKSGVYKKLIVFDGVKIPLPDGSVNTVVSNCVFEHVEKLDDLLGEIYRVLKGGGKIYTTVMNQSWEENLIGTRLFGERYKKFMRKIQDHNNLLMATEWNKKFRKAGFDVVLEKGYLTTRACKIIEAAHYLSFPSLVFYYLWGKWSLGTGWARFWRWDSLEAEMKRVVDIREAGALFVVARKTFEK